jgi:hypothetical protein
VGTAPTGTQVSLATVAALGRIEAIQSGRDGQSGGEEAIRKRTSTRGG